MEITQEITNLCINKDLDDAIEGLEKLGTLTFVDEKIADGIDNDEDAYLMMRSFDLSINSKTYYIRLFYGDCSRIVGCVEAYVR